MQWIGGEEAIESQERKGIECLLNCYMIKCDKHGPMEVLSYTLWQWYGNAHGKNSPTKMQWSVLATNCLA